MKAIEKLTNKIFSQAEPGQSLNKRSRSRKPFQIYSSEFAD